jgi:hypothetical protein
VRSLAQIHTSVPGLVVKSVRQSKVFGCEIEGLLHVRKAKSGTGVICFRVQLKKFLNDIICDGWKENPQLSRHISGSVDAGVGLAIGLVKLVGYDKRTREVEALLVKLCFIRVGDDITVHSGLKLISVV